MQLNEEMMCVVCVCVSQRGHSSDGCDLASTLCKYDLRKGALFVLNWASVRGVRRGSSELLMCGGSVHSMLLLPRDNRCMYMAHVTTSIRHKHQQTTDNAKPRTQNSNWVYNRHKHTTSTRRNTQSTHK